jgi:hypothetical protein
MKFKKLEIFRLRDRRKNPARKPDPDDVMKEKPMDLIMVT